MGLLLDMKSNIVNYSSLRNYIGLLSDTVPNQDSGMWSTTANWT